MLTIICGEDSVQSRSYFQLLRKHYQEKGNFIYDIKPTEFFEIKKYLSDSVSLFDQKPIFFVEKLNKNISKRSSPDFFNLVQELSKKNDVEIIVWEPDISSRELKLSKNVKIKEFKPQASIFKLLDACYPGNLDQFISLLNSLSEDVDEMFVFVMLIKQFHNLLIIKNGGNIKSLHPWQFNKLKLQARFWNYDKLLSFYDGLYRIEVALKTGTNPFPVKKSVELLACYLL